MKKKNRAIEIFSMSALDLFASAMGAFVMLSVMMLPYYFKGKEYETQIGDLSRQKAQAEFAAGQAAIAAALAAQEAEAEKAKPAPTAEAEAKSLGPERAALKAALEKASEATSEIEDIKQRIDEEEELAKTLTEPKTPKKQKVKVTFRFLGLKTDKESYLIMVDGSARVKQFATNLPEILSGIVSVFGPEKKLAVKFYYSVNDTYRERRWPDAGYVPGDDQGRADALKFMSQAYGQMTGGSATYQALRNAVAQESAQSIILVSDGFIFPKHNEGKYPDDVVSAVSAANRKKVEINSVAVGVFYKSRIFAEFLNEISEKNQGDFKAIPP